MADNLVPSGAFKSLRKLTLKDPNPVKIACYSLSRVFVKITEHSGSLPYLRQVTLSRLGLDMNSLMCLADSVTCLQNLRSLDISQNGLNANHLIAFFNKILGNNTLKSLNVSYNSGFKKIRNAEEERFEDSISNFLHFQNGLVHFDMSGLALPYESLEEIALNGIRKSRTLQCVHLSGMNLNEYQQADFRKALRVIEVCSRKGQADPRID